MHDECEPNLSGYAIKSVDHHYFTKIKELPQSSRKLHLFSSYFEPIGS